MKLTDDGRIIITNDSKEYISISKEDIPKKIINKLHDKMESYENGDEPYTITRKAKAKGYMVYNTQTSTGEDTWNYYKRYKLEYRSLDEVLDELTDAVEAGEVTPMRTDTLLYEDPDMYKVQVWKNDGWYGVGFPQKSIANAIEREQSYNGRKTRIVKVVTQYYEVTCDENINRDDDMDFFEGMD